MKLLYNLFMIVLLAVISTSNAHRNVVSFAVRETFCQLSFKSCDDSGTASPTGKILGVSFNGSCSSPGIANLIKGTVIQIDFQFQSYQVESVLTSKVQGKIDQIPYWVNFPLGNPDACKDSGLTCPINANTTLDYKPLLSVLTAYPEVEVIVKWRLVNQAGADVFCVVIPAVITH